MKLPKLTINNHVYLAITLIDCIALVLVIVLPLSNLWLALVLYLAIAFPLQLIAEIKPNGIKQK